MPLTEKVVRSGLDLSGRTRPTLGMLPRGNWLRHYYYDFPALLGGGIDRLIDYGLQQFAQAMVSPGAPNPLAMDRFILTAHSGGGGGTLHECNGGHDICDFDIFRAAESRRSLSST